MSAVQGDRNVFLPHIKGAGIANDQLGRASLPSPYLSSLSSSSSNDLDISLMRMQVAAAPPITTQSSIVKPESPEWEDMKPVDRLQRQMSEYDRTAAEQYKRTHKGEMKREESQSKERRDLCMKYHKDHAKQENEKKENLKEINPPGNMASQNGGFNNAISTKTESGRKRKADEEPFKTYPKPPMMNNPEQWQMHHMQSMNYHQQQMIHHQYNNQQRVPPNGMPMYNNNFYPPCTTAASTSELASFPEVPQMNNNSPVVLPSVNGTGPGTGTPPQMAGQNNTEQHPTPPALMNTQGGGASTDLCGFDNVEQIEQFLPDNMPLCLKDLGNDLDNELGPTDFDQPSSSAGQQPAAHSVGTPSNVVSPADGFQLQVNGPQSNHSQQNPMSNSHCNPPITPTNQQQSQQQQQQQMVQFPPIGNPLLTSTPKNPMNPVNPMVQHNHQGMMNGMNGLQSPATMPSPHMMPAALQSPHMGMGNHQSPGLPPAANPAVSMGMPHNPTGMAHGMPPMSGMAPGMPWGGHQWNGMMPGNMQGVPPNFAPEMRMDMPYPTMTPQQQQQYQMQHMRHVQVVQNFLQSNPIPPEYLMNIKIEVQRRREALIQGGFPIDRIEIECNRVHQVRTLQMGSWMLQNARKRYEQQMMAAGHQPSPSFATYSSTGFPAMPSYPHPLHPYPNML